LPRGARADWAKPARREASTPIGMVKIIGHKMGTTHSV
jgi:hypothetical protein